MKELIIIGMGLSPEDLTTKHMEIIKNADILMGGKRHLSYFRDMPVTKKEISGDMDAAVRFIRENMEEKSIALLASGDPLYFGVGAYITRELGVENVKFFPNVSSISGAFARMKEEWGTARVISLHGRHNEDEFLRAVCKHPCVAVFTDRKRNPAWIAGFLKENNVLHVKIGVFERMGTGEERTGWYDIDEAISLSFMEPNVVVIKREVDIPKDSLPLHLGLPETAFEHEHGLITKSEIRAIVISNLRLLPDHVLWDIGAGSGSISIEASLLLKNGRIFALEQKPDRIENIRDNIKRFGIRNVSLVRTSAPEGLDDLPKPDRVFIGGGGSRLKDIIIESARHLRPDGVIVVNAVLFSNLEIALNTLREAGFDAEFIQVQVHRGKMMPGGERLEALNPVWIIKGQKIK